MPTPGTFVEIAADVWVARHEAYDVNVTLVRGERGVVVVDTHASEPAGRAVIEQVRALGIGDVVEIVNTHEHFDHVLGTGAFRAAYGAGVPVHAHETAAAAIAAAAASAEAGDTPYVVPDRTFSSATVIDLGDRYLELVHPGRGHTAGDLVVRVPHADVVLAGDLIEESEARDATPGFGPDCWPMEWPLSLDIVLSLSTTSTVVVPGHGAVVDRAFVEDQRNDIGILAETIRDLAGRGIPVGEAVAAADAWPFPAKYLDDAVRRAYEQLPRSQKRLPLL